MVEINGDINYKIIAEVDDGTIIICDKRYIESVKLCNECSANDVSHLITCINTPVCDIEFHSSGKKAFNLCSQMNANKLKQKFV